MRDQIVPIAVVRQFCLREIQFHQRVLYRRPKFHVPAGQRIVLRVVQELLHTQKRTVPAIPFRSQTDALRAPHCAKISRTRPLPEVIDRLTGTSTRTGPR